MEEITGHKVDLNKKKLERIMPKNFRLIKYTRIPNNILYLNEFFVFEKMDRSRYTNEFANPTIISDIKPN